MLKYIKIVLLILTVALLFLTQFVYIDRKAECSILIIPSLQPSNLKTKDLIRLVKETSPKHYQDLCKYVNVINKNPSCGGLDGGCYQKDKPGTIYLGNDQGNPALGASIIAHELCHVKQALENRPLDEPECYTIGNSYLESITIY